jgi:hypothetical protein
VLGSVDGSSSLAASMSTVVELLEGQINTGAANGVRWGSHFPLVATVLHFLELKTKLEWLILCTSLVITHIKLDRSLPYLLATTMSINLTNYSGVMLGVTVDASAVVAVVMMVGVVFLITSVCLFWKHASFLLLATTVSSLSSFSSVILFASGRSSITTRLCCEVQPPFGLHHPSGSS